MHNLLQEARSKVHNIPLVQSGSTSSAIFCFCQSGDDGSKMIKCSSKDCMFQWFHFNCVGIVENPPGEWFCGVCQSGKTCK